MHRPPGRNFRRLLFAALLSASVLPSGIALASEVPPLRALSPPLFSGDVAVEFDSVGTGAVRVTVTVPYSELSWSRVDGDYRAGAAFSVELQSERGGRLYGDAWQERVRVSSHAATNSNRSHLIVRRRLQPPPGRYRVRIRVRDLQGEQESSAQERIEVADASRSPVGFADMTLGVLDSTGFRAVPTRQLGLEASSLAVRVALFDRRGGAWPRAYRLRVRVVDDAGEPTLQKDTSLTVTRSAEPFLLRASTAGLLIGAHQVELELIDGKQRFRAVRSFEVEESGAPAGRDWDLMLEALAYVAEPEEIDAMRPVRDPEERTAAWEAFWRRRDPTPETQRNEYQLEFFRRLRHADRAFQGFGPGWRSDMGRIYIRFGPPDQVEQRTATAGQPALEIWSYNQPYRRFIFADREGFGRFTLLQPGIE